MVPHVIEQLAVFGGSAHDNGDKKSDASACGLRRGDTSCMQPHDIRELATDALHDNNGADAGLRSSARMSLQSLTRRGMASSSGAQPARPCRRSLACLAQQNANGNRTWQHTVAKQLLSAGLSAGLLLCPMAPGFAADYKSLADVMRADFAFVDSNKDGVVTASELQAQAKQIAEDEGFPIPEEEQLKFTVRLFDLNQDGTLTTEEMLTGLALDATVDDDGVDQDVMTLFDTNNDGYVELPEFKSKLGNLGPQGEQVKEYVFNKVNTLEDANGKLDSNGFGNAMALMRTVILGY